MRRLLRILLTVAAIVSLAACVGTVAVWVRSYWVRDELQWESFEAEPGGAVGRENWVVSQWGGVNLRSGVSHLMPGVRMMLKPGRHLTTRPAGAYPRIAWGTLGWWNRLGFWSQNDVVPPAYVNTIGGGRDYFGRGGTERRLTLPYWSVALVFAALPAWAAMTARRRRREARVAANLCAACGYDLRATPDRCPECGAVPKVTA